jgi:hypothetical protein
MWLSTKRFSHIATSLKKKMLPSPPSSVFYNSPLSMTGVDWGYPIPRARIEHLDELLRRCLPIGPAIQLDHELDDEAIFL